MMISGVRPELVWHTWHSVRPDYPWDAPRNCSESSKRPNSALPKGVLYRSTQLAGARRVRHDTVGRSGTILAGIPSCWLSVSSGEPPQIFGQQYDARLSKE